MKTKIIALLLCMVSLQSIAQKKSQETLEPNVKGLDTALQHVLKNYHIAGFAVAVVYKNKIIYAKGFGYRDVANKLPVTPNTLFAIGSCSKAFTATLIGKLQKDGKVDIDKPVTTYLPTLKFYNDNMGNTITLRDMMSHVTGLPRHDASWYFFSTPSTDSLVQRLQYQEPTYGVRQKWQYNNFMFATQGYLVEKLTGKSWEENIRESIFEPLGMVRSDVTIDELLKTDDIATGYDVKKDTIIHKLAHYNINGMAPAGAINSSVNEMAKWVTAWINNGKYNGKEIIPESFRNEAISSQAVAGAGLPGKEKSDLFFSNYGFAWSLSSYKGHYRVEHGGAIDGFTASTSFFPSDSVGVIVLTNQGGSPVPPIARNIVVDKVLGLKYYDWNGEGLSALKKGIKERKKADSTKVASKTHNPASHQLADYTGSFNNKGYGTMKLYIRHDSLFLQTVTHTLWLRHNNYDTFDSFDNDPTEGIDTTGGGEPFQFRMNVSGDIDGIESAFEDGLKPILFNRVIDAKPLSAAELQKYVGEYDLNGINIKVYIKDAKALYALVPGQPDYELVAMGNDKFNIKVLSGYYLQFGPEKADKITEATFIQPNGSFKSKKK